MGICTTKAQMIKLSDRIGTEYIDEYIPLPGMTLAAQAKLILDNKANGHEVNPSNVRYWETNDGSHGWCSLEDGQVVQWG